MYGNINLTVPAGTQSNDKFRIKGKGVTNVSTKRNGDMYVVSDVVIPEKLNSDLNKLLFELSNTDVANASKFKKYNKYVSK